MLERGCGGKKIELVGNGAVKKVEDTYTEIKRAKRERG